MLVSSFLSLGVVGVPVVVVFRSIGPLVTRAFERILLDKHFDYLEVLPLSVVVAGALEFSMFERSVSLWAYSLLTLNLFMYSILVVLEGRYVKRFANEQTAPGWFHLRNIVCAVVCFGFSMCVGEFPAVRQFWTHDLFLSEIGGGGSGFWFCFLLLSSAVTAFGLGVCYFFLQTVVSPTAIAMANLTVKLITPAISLLFFKFSVEFFAALGLLVSFVGITLHAVYRIGDVIRTSSGGAGGSGSPTLKDRAIMLAAKKESEQSDSDDGQPLLETVVDNDKKDREESLKTINLTSVSSSSLSSTSSTSNKSHPSTPSSSSFSCSSISSWLTYFMIELVPRCVAISSVLFLLFVCGVMLFSLRLWAQHREGRVMMRDQAGRILKTSAFVVSSFCSVSCFCFFLSASPSFSSRISFLRLIHYLPTSRLTCLLIFLLC